MATGNTQMNKNLPALALVTMLASLVLAACDSSTPDVNGNFTANDGEVGSQPRTSFTFATDPNLVSNRRSNPGEGVLRSTLASNSVTSFNDLQVLVFGPMCSGCHIGGGQTQPSVMDMTTADASYANLVNQPSTNLPSQTLVIPGNTDTSYLVDLLEGTQATGSRMPMRSSPLSDELIASVRAWIDNGAPR